MPIIKINKKKKLVQSVMIYPTFQNLFYCISEVTFRLDARGQ